MREDSMNKFRGWLVALIQIGAFLLFAATVFAQETTAGLQGTVKDPSGAVVANATVVVTANTLVGDKTIKTDSNGYYRLANLPALRDLVVRDIWLLRLRALLARARGDDVAYRDLASRYRAMAESLGFEGHIAMAEAMV